MLDRVAQPGEGLLQLLVGRYRNLLRKPPDKIPPILAREDRVVGRQSVEGALDHLKNVRLCVKARFSHALHEIGIEPAGAASHLIEIRDVNVISFVLCKRCEIRFCKVQQRRGDLGLIDHQLGKLRGI